MWIVKRRAYLKNACNNFDINGMPNKKMFFLNGNKSSLKKRNEKGAATKKNIAVKYSCDLFCKHAHICDSPMRSLTHISISNIEIYLKKN